VKPVHDLKQEVGSRDEARQGILVSWIPSANHQLSQTY